MIDRVLDANTAPEFRFTPMLTLPFTCPDDITDMDVWPWEGHVRHALWQDERLPFYGPYGQFGFWPASNSGWQPSQRPSITPGQVHGYLDELGGIWQWEGGRAALHTPYEGHWNVQLIGSAFQAWENHIAILLGQRVRLRSNHVNIEADGSIVDDTFDVL